MKKMKSGFTLAEVLITLGIIGVVASIVMPSVMTNYTYKTVGVKLAKFVSQVEGSTRPFVVQNETFRIDDASGVNNVATYIEESFLLKNASDFDGVEKKLTTAKVDRTSGATGWSSDAVISENQNLLKIKETFCF